MSVFNISFPSFWQRDVFFNIVNRLSEKNNASIQIPQRAGKYIVSQSSVTRQNGTARVVEFSDKIKTLVDAELASPSGILRSSLSCNEANLLATYWPTLAAGFGPGTYESWAIPSEITEEVLNLYIIVGHSIAAMRNLISTYSAPLQTTLANTLGAWSSYTGSFFSESVNWKPMGPYLGSDNNQFGSSSLAFAYQMVQANPGKKIGVIHNAAGGSSIAIDWSRDSNNNMYLDTQRIVPYYLQRCPTKYKIQGAFIHLGENDASVLARAQAWGTGIENLISMLRTVSGKPNLPVALAPIDPTSSLTHKSIINSSCISLAASIPNVGVLDATGWLVGTPDGVHLSSAKLEQVGLQLSNYMSPLMV